MTLSEALDARFASAAPRASSAVCSMRICCWRSRELDVAVRMERDDRIEPLVRGRGTDAGAEPFKPVRSDGTRPCGHHRECAPRGAPIAR